MYLIFQCFSGFPFSWSFWHVGLSECSMLGKSTYPKKKESTAPSCSTKKFDLRTLGLCLTLYTWWFKPWPFWDGEFTWPFQGVKSWPPTIGDEVWARLESPGSRSFWWMEDGPTMSNCFKGWWRWAFDFLLVYVAFCCGVGAWLLRYFDIPWSYFTLGAEHDMFINLSP